MEGLSLTDSAVEYLIGAVGPDVGLLSSELRKLTMTGKKSLDAADIKEYVRGSGDYDVFDLVNALKAKNTTEVMRIYKTLSETQEPHSLLGALNWHYSRVPQRKGPGRKGNGSRQEIFALLSEADLMLKSTGGVYPVEYLLFRLLRL